MLSHAAANFGPRPVTDLNLIPDHQMLDFQRLIHSYNHTLVHPSDLFSSSFCTTNFLWRTRWNFFLGSQRLTIVLKLALGAESPIKTMRPPRLLLLLFCFIAFPIFLTFLSLLSAHPRDADALAAGYGTKSRRLSALFSFHTPAALFPPSAIISLTDDNSTFFLARPAAFGPVLPSDGLSSQLWVGSGFGDDNLRKAGSILGAEGELGCSDVPGWGEGDKKHHDEEPSNKQKKRPKALAPGKTDKGPVSANLSGGKTKRTREDDDDEDPIAEFADADSPTENDGTDDHLHHPLPESNPAEPAQPGQPADHESITDKSKSPTHADIQSLQESAEIAGKVVLLSRGGCGFLEKVKWVQRRGGVALIVGDDARGGQLITMYARGDTSNVTIPAIFTSHTTAHLLSSLIPLETADEQGTDGGKDTKSRTPAQKPEEDGPTFTAKITTRPTARPGSSNKDAKISTLDGETRIANTSWLGRMLSFLGLKGGAHYPWHVSEDSRRPPSSGNIDWILLEDWDERTSSTGPQKAPLQKPHNNINDGKHGKPSSSSQKPRPSSSSGDDFVIGIQDWRDPDVLTPVEKQDTIETSPNGRVAGKDDSKLEQSKQQPTGKSGKAEVLKGGSITPGSGEYGHASAGHDGKSGADTVRHTLSDDSSLDSHSDGSERSWFSRLLWSKSPDHPAAGAQKSEPATGKTASEKSSTSSPATKKPLSLNEQAAGEHEGLWVTLTPATMSTSPFLDTLLVLVVSPLVTLTVVYALLLLRSRIRRRRWRAPKSVVERLPVRVYHTMSSASSTSSSHVSTPANSSPTSPLLRSTSRTIPCRSRPRSQTTSGVIAATEPTSDGPSAASSPAKEKTTSNTPVWRKRYTGRQIECVVCLEEYVDGQSRVMSLPCGHEFHADCM
jgi:RING-like zinc finger/PA domain